MHIKHLPPVIHAQAAAGALFYVSHSGGKDSQAMYLAIRDIVPHDQIVVVHADLLDVEHTGAQEHIRATISHELHVVQAIFADGSPKGLLDVVERKIVSRPDAPPWPSSAQRWCTSDLKRGPIEKFIRGDLKARGKLHAVNCIGLRAEESVARSKRESTTLNKRLSKAGRRVWDWLPVHDWLVADVFDCIRGHSQEPHAVYAAGNERFSCVFCIFGSDNDLRNGAHQNPALARRYIEIEERSGYSLFPKRTLASRLAGIPIHVEK